MPTKTYHLDEARTEKITLQWGMFWRNFQAFYNDAPLAEPAGRAELTQGLSYPLPTGQVLTTRLRTGFGEQLELLLDGAPVAGSATHPQEQIKQAWYVLLFLGLVNAGLGILNTVANIEVLTILGFGWPSVLMGSIYLGLGWWGKTKGAALAFYIALGILVLDTVLVIATISESNLGTGGTAGIFVRIFFGLALWRGAQGAKALQQTRRAVILDVDGAEAPQ